MKITIALSSLLVVLPAVVSAATLPEPLFARQFGRQNGRAVAAKGGNAAAKGAAAKGAAAAKGGNAAAKGGNAAAAAASSAAATTAAASAAVTETATANNPDLQSSLTLDPSVIATGFESNGQEVQEAGQVASLTSDNNFINFCATVNKPITNGEQLTGGSCNPAPMGVIASTANMPSSKFTFPANGDTIAANQAFTISMAINHIETGNFVNAQSNYYSAPQQVNSQGDIIGHTHVVVELLDSLGQTTPTDPSKFAFFKGVNGVAVNGVVTADVTNGLPDGFYRLASINAAANHQPVLVAIAQHGSLDDMVYFTVSANGAAASNSSAAASAGAGAAAASNSSAAASAGAGAAASANSTASAGAAKGANSAQGGAAAAKGVAAGAGAASAAAGKGAAGAGTAAAGSGAAAAKGGAATGAAAAKGGAAAGAAAAKGGAAAAAAAKGGAAAAAAAKGGAAAGAAAKGGAAAGAAAKGGAAAGTAAKGAAAAKGAPAAKGAAAGKAGRSFARESS